jgi:5-methylcytosine-specific restriction endonuclease McrA
MRLDNLFGLDKNNIEVNTIVDMLRILERYKIGDNLYRIAKITKDKNRYYYYKLFTECKNCKKPFLARIDSTLAFCSYKCAKTGIHHPCLGIKRTDNLNRLKDNHPMKSPIARQKVSEALKGIKRPYNTGEKNPMNRAEVRDKVSRIQKGMKRPNISGEKSRLWKGGVKAKNIPLFDTYSNRLITVNDVRRDPQNIEILQVKCKYCEEWFTPSATNVENRIKAINGRATGEHNLYCSQVCKTSCSIFQQKKYPKDNKPYTTRKDQKELRKYVLERDEYKCQICGNNNNLICHHIKPVSLEPIESADLDNCITLCKECEQKVHKLPGCNFHELRKCD